MDDNNRISVEEYKKMKSKKRKSKYKNTPTPYNGRKYDSKLEADCAKRLDFMQKLGLIHSWEDQKKFYITKRTSHKVDFVVWLDSKPAKTAIWVEAKGFDNKKKKWLDLPHNKRSRKQVEDTYGIEIHLVKSPTELEAKILAMIDEK